MVVGGGVKILRTADLGWSTCKVLPPRTHTVGPQKSLQENKMAA